VAQVAECLPSKHEALSSIPNTKKKNLIRMMSIFVYEGLTVPGIDPSYCKKLEI
jgi:hypothetical protein